MGEFIACNILSANSQISPRYIEHAGNNSRNVLSEDIFAFDTTFDLSDDVLANTPVPENTLTSNINNFCANSVFNNCTVDFCHEKSNICRYVNVWIV